MSKRTQAQHFDFIGQYYATESKHAEHREIVDETVFKELGPCFATEYRETQRKIAELS